jgi:hypothetical protein
MEIWLGTPRKKPGSGEPTSRDLTILPPSEGLKAEHFMYFDVKKLKLTNA